MKDDKVKGMLSGKCYFPSDLVLAFVQILNFSYSKISILNCRRGSQK